MTDWNKFWEGNDWTFEKLDIIDKECEKIAVEELKLDCFPNQIEIITAEQMMNYYTSHGLPLMYNHWSFGKQFIQQFDTYKKGQSGLAMEIIINSNPSIAYCMEENTMTIQALVIAHASYGHNSFFKNNFLFKQWTTPDAIVDYFKFAKNYISKCEERYGYEAVEEILDSCHSLMYHGVDKYIKPKKLSKEKEFERMMEREEHRQQRLDDLWRTLPESSKKKEEIEKRKEFLSEPEENILYFVEKNSPTLQTWQREIVRIVRKMSQYFFPQMQCLTGNHRISTKDGLLRLDEIITKEGIDYSPSLKLLTEGNKLTKVSHTYKNKANTLKITTRSGRTFQGTPEHPLQSWSNLSTSMQRLDSMNVGDYLAYRLSYDIFSTTDTKIEYPQYETSMLTCNICGVKAYNLTSHLSQKHNISANDYDEKVISDKYRLERSKNKITNKPKYFTYDIARLFGYISNFNVSAQNTNQSKFSFSTDNLNIADDIATLFHSIFGINTKIIHDNGYKIQFNSFMLKSLYYHYFDTTRKHQIPSFVYSLNKESMRGFIRGFFDSRTTNYQFERGVIKLNGYSDDEQDYQDLMTLMLGFGICPIIKAIERESIESLLYTLGIENMHDIKACNYILQIPADYSEQYFHEIGTTRSSYKVLKATKYVPGAMKLVKKVKKFIKSEIKKHTSNAIFKKTNYDFKVKNKLLLKHTHLDFLDKFPRLDNKEISVHALKTNVEFLTRLKNLNSSNESVNELIYLIENCEKLHYDEIVKIENGGEHYVYDVTVPENHLFWTNGIISHNTQIANEGWATFIHYHIMNRLWEKGILPEGSYLEFIKSHTGVVNQMDWDSKYFSGKINPYWLGFNMFMDIKRICENPTDEDKQWFPDIAGSDWLETVTFAMKNFKDESFIRQYLSPHLIRKLKLFVMNDNHSSSEYQITAISDEDGYKKIREALAKSKELTSMIPEISIVDFDIDGDRTLFLQHIQVDGVPINVESAEEVLRHLHRLWGFDVVLETKSEEGEVVDIIGCITSEENKKRKSAIEQKKYHDTYGYLDF